MRPKKLLPIAVTFGVLGVATVAYAYVERTSVARPTSPAYSGCLQQISGVSHGGANDPVTLTLDVTVPGRTSMTSQQCTSDWPAGTASFLVAQPIEFLIKLRNTNDASQGFYICDTPSLTLQILVPGIHLSTTYATPPCGAGYYALVSCLTNVTSYTSTPTGVVTGTYSATWANRDCNISPNYHPVGVGDNVTPGPQVVLP